MSFFFGSQAEYEQAMANQAAQVQSRYLEFYDFIERLDYADMNTLAWMMHRVQHDPGFAEHVIGTMAGRTRWRDGKCGCGDEIHPVSDHLDPAWVLGAQEKKSDSAIPETTNDDEDFAQMVAKFSVQKFFEAGSEDELARFAGLMDKWGVNYVGEDTTSVSNKVSCNNCGRVYESLADRMVKPPGIENCDGCVQKTKWG